MRASALGRGRLGDRLAAAAAARRAAGAGGAETRTFTTFTQAATEDARSRIYLGVHYQIDADDGLATGYAVANLTTTRYFQGMRCDTSCW